MGFPKLDARLRAGVVAVRVPAQHLTMERICFCEYHDSGYVVGSGVSASGEAWAIERLGPPGSGRLIVSTAAIIARSTSPSRPCQYGLRANPRRSSFTDRSGSAVPTILPCSRCGITSRPGHRPDVVQGPRQRRYAVGRDAAVGGFEAGDAAECRRKANRATGIRAERRETHSGSPPRWLIRRNCLPASTRDSTDYDRRRIRWFPR